MSGGNFDGVSFDSSIGGFDVDATADTHDGFDASDLNRKLDRQREERDEERKSHREHLRALLEAGGLFRIGAAPAPIPKYPNSVLWAIFCLATKESYTKHHELPDRPRCMLCSRCMLQWCLLHVVCRMLQACRCTRNATACSSRLSNFKYSSS